MQHQGLHTLSLLILVLAQALSVTAQNTPWLDSLITSLPTYLRHIAEAPDDFELQVLYRPLDGPDSNKTFTYGLAPDRYFYPASTVKLPMAALALQHLNELSVLGLTSGSPMRQSQLGELKELAALGLTPMLPASSDLTGSSDPRTHERVGMPGTPATVMGHVRDIAIVSSNEAYNRLYEWIGPRYAEEEFARRGWTARIIARLGAPAYNAFSNRLLNPTAFLHVMTEHGDTVYYRGPSMQPATAQLPLTGQVKGRGFYHDASQQVIRKPFDFSSKNFIPLTDLANTLQAIVAPETMDSHLRFRMREEDRDAFVYALRTPPRDSDNPLHHSKPDGYVNFLYYGGDGDWEFGGPLIYNKVGDAYGYLTDVAIFEDPYTGHRYLLAATIHVNANGIYNDGNYEYEEIGLPYLKELGRTIWARRRAGG